MHSKNSIKFVCDEKFDLADILFDEDNSNPIILKDYNGVSYRFNQLAILMLESTYLILKPIDEIDGVSDDEVFVSKIAPAEADKVRLVMVDDNDIVDRVIDAYNKLRQEY